MIQLILLFATAFMTGKPQLSLLMTLALLGASDSLLPGTPNRTHDPVDLRAFHSVLDGFSYVGPFECRNFEIQEHGLNTQPIPDSAAPDVCYVFHRPGRTTTSLAVQITHRLQEVKADIQRAPKTVDDFAYILPGGPLFRIDFRYAGRDGSFLTVQGNHLHAPGSEKWSRDDYVVRFH